MTEPQDFMPALPDAGIDHPGNSATALRAVQRRPRRAVRPRVADDVSEARPARERARAHAQAHPEAESGTWWLDLAPCELGQTLQAVVDLYGARVQDKGLEFVVDLAPELPLRLFGDARRLTQVLSQLVDNALRFTTQGHIRIAVRELPAVDGRHCLLRFSVHDSGRGIDPAHCAELFPSRDQLTSQTDRSGGASGRGLPLCRQLVETMGGRIGVESAPGQGSDFWFTAELQRIGVASGGRPAAAADVAGLRVLLVDGGSSTGRVIEAQLRAWQVAVARSANALGAARQIERLRHTPECFDLVLLDWQASDVDGLRELMQGLGRKDAAAPAPPTVMLTDRSRDAQNRAVGGVQVDAVLVKPVLAAPLLAALRQAVQARAARAALVVGAAATAGL